MSVVSAACSCPCSWFVTSPPRSRATAPALLFPAQLNNVAAASAPLPPPAALNYLPGLRSVLTLGCRLIILLRPPCARRKARRTITRRTITRRDCGRGERRQEKRRIQKRKWSVKQTHAFTASTSASMSCSSLVGDLLVSCLALCVFVDGVSSRWARGGRLGAPGHHSCLRGSMWSMSYWREESF